MSNPYDSKTIDELEEIKKLLGSEKLIVSDGITTNKVSVNTLAGYIAGIISKGKQTIVDNDSELLPNDFYLEEESQISIKTEVTIPTSITVSSNLGLRRVEELK